jgi:predicted metalloprotease with PDZ domain
MESPILVGQLRRWEFRVKNVPHHVFYMPGSAPVAFDTAAFLNGIQRIVEQTSNVFARMPYREYYFLIADDAYGGLEHPNSVTLGARSAQLAENPYATAEEVGHEFFHTWNLMSIKPAEYRGVDYRVQRPVSSLWFSEGLSVFYADLMMRRAGFIMDEPTRIHHLQVLVERYLRDPVYERYSAEDISRVEYNTPAGTLGNFDPSSHLIGEMIAGVLDFLVRDATDGRRTIDDVMRKMEERHTGRGFTGRDVERAVADVCACNATEFFDRHVRGHARVDMNRYLEPFGLRMTVETKPVVSQNGEVERDFRIGAFQPTPQDTLRLLLWQGGGIWGAAGLNTNDRILSVNGKAVKTWPEFRSAIVAVPLGQTVTFDIVRGASRMQIPVVMSGYQREAVTITEIPNATPRQQRLRTQWLAGQ